MAGDQFFEFGNAGRGPAFDLRFEEKGRDFPRDLHGEAPPLRFWVRLEPIPYLAVGANVRARWQYRTEEDTAGVWRNVSNSDRFNMEGIPNRWVFPVKISYQDLAGHGYEQDLDAQAVGDSWVANFGGSRFIKEPIRRAGAPKRPRNLKPRLGPRP